MKGNSTDRGQLVLVGAVSFAVILIAIAVVFSTTLFTASVGSSGTVETVSDGTGTEQSVERTTEGLLERVNQQNDWLLTQNETFLDRSGTFDEPTLQSHLQSNVSTYDELYAESKTQTGPTYVNSSAGGIQYGTRLTQDWHTFGSTISDDTIVTDQRVADFAVMVNSSESVGGTVIVTATGAGGGTSTVELDDTGTGSALEISSSDDGNPSQDCTFNNPTDGTVYVDLTSGFAADEPFDPDTRRTDCLDALNEGLEAPYDVTVDVTPDMYFAYDYTINGSSPSPIGSTVASTDDVIWSTDVSLVYETPTVLRETTTEVSSYEP